MMKSATIYYYRPRNLLLIPEKVKTEAGFYIECEPVLSANFDDLLMVKNIFQSALNNSISRVATPQTIIRLKDVPTVKAARARSYTDFVRNSLSWNIEELQDGGVQIQRWISPPRENSFIPDTNDRFAFYPGYSIDAVFEKFISFVNQARSTD